MTSLPPGDEVKDLLEKMTLGVVKTLESKPGVCDVQFENCTPAEKSAIYSWEQRNMCTLPNDLKDFFLTTNGLSIQWSIIFDGETLPIGNIQVNSIASLVSLNQSPIPSNEAPSLLDLDDISDDEGFHGHDKPHFDQRNKIYELDSCLGFAKVCLVFKNVANGGMIDTSPEIWLLDRSLSWSFLASSFENYFRMLIIHLGLPLWQYRFSTAGLSLETKEWFNLYAPSRVTDDLSDEHMNVTSAEQTNQLDPNLVFKGKADIVKVQTRQGKKKLAARSTTSSKSQGTSAIKSHRY